MAVSSPDFHPEALREADAGLLWYLERSPAAARRFMAELERAIDHICEAPERWPRYVLGTRRFVLLKFPYSLVYRPTESSVQILAVAHSKRRPGYWKPRLG